MMLQTDFCLLLPREALVYARIAVLHATPASACTRFSAPASTVIRAIAYVLLLQGCLISLLAAAVRVYDWRAKEV